jgi:hypothetical protein
VFAVSALVVGVGISQAVLIFGQDEKPGRAAFLVFWALVILVICLFGLLCMRMSNTAFRGAAAIARRPGESQAEADARADARAWTAGVAVVAFAGILCFAFILLQAIKHY